MRPDDFAGQSATLGIWPDNVPAVAVFLSVATQWRMGFAGPTGLDYGVLPAVLRLHGVPRRDWPNLFSDLRTLESAALTTLRKKE